MLTIKIHNDGTGTDDEANYTWRVDVNGREIDHGVVRGHDRSHGWEALVAAILFEAKCRRVQGGE